MKMINPVLLQAAARAVEKKAFVPAANMDPNAPAGAPPMDPSGAGGAPPMDPSMMVAAGGMPPMDPSMMGAAAGGGMPPMDPSMMAAAGGMPADPNAAAAAPAPAASASASGGKSKLDADMVYLQLGRMIKLITNLYQQLGVQLPPDMLDDQKILADVKQDLPPDQAAAPKAASAGEPYQFAATESPEQDTLTEQRQRVDAILALVKSQQRGTRVR